MINVLVSIPVLLFRGWLRLGSIADPLKGGGTINLPRTDLYEARKISIVGSLEKSELITNLRFISILATLSGCRNL